MTFTFRPGTCDENVYRSIVELNEYRLPDKFDPSDVIVDIGAHIGAFTKACLDRGAQHIIAFEPEPDNFAIFRSNLREAIDDGRVEVFPLAVTGACDFEWRKHSGYTAINGETNTGGGFLFGPNGESFVHKEYVVSRPVRVPSISLDDALDGVEEVRLLKMDCEGSEWGILRNISLYVPDMAEIVGEYHEFGKNTQTELSMILDGLRYDSSFQQHGEHPMGLFFAKLRA